MRICEGGRIEGTPNRTFTSVECMNEKRCVVGGSNRRPWRTITHWGQRTPDRRLQQRRRQRRARDAA